MKVWIATSNDEYRFIEYMADSATALAEMLGVRTNAIYSAVSHAKARGTNSRYECVEIGDIDER